MLSKEGILFCFWFIVFGLWFLNPMLTECFFYLLKTMYHILKFSLFC